MITNFQQSSSLPRRRPKGFVTRFAFLPFVGKETRDEPLAKDADVLRGSSRVSFPSRFLPFVEKETRDQPLAKDADVLRGSSSVSFPSRFLPFVGKEKRDEPLAKDVCVGG